MGFSQLEHHYHILWGTNVVFNICTRVVTHRFSIEQTAGMVIDTCFSCMQRVGGSFVEFLALRGINATEWLIPSNCNVFRSGRRGPKHLTCSTKHPEGKACRWEGGNITWADVSPGGHPTGLGNGCCATSFHLSPSEKREKEKKGLTPVIHLWLE